ncbi:MAG: SusC/RagA family TonB-linked outer membrane protein, partial [Chitinophagaceae bacterium]
SNIDAKVTKRLKIGVQVNGRQEVRTNPGVPGGDDYWLPRFAILRNLPYERPYANDNPEYLNTISQNDANWGFINYKNAGKFKQEWRVLQLNGDAEWQVPGIKGLTLRGVYSYYIADLLYNNQEYTYRTYTYRPATDVYEQTGGSINPWREKEQVKQINVTTQAQLNYNANFGEHSIAATVVAERISNQRRRNWARSIPPSNALALMYFATFADYQDQEERSARVGYIGRVNYNYANKYYVELSGRRDGSSAFPPALRSALFPMASIGWRITNENFMKNVFGGHLTDLKLRASYGRLGDDNYNEGFNSDQRGFLPSFFFLEGYRYNANGVAIINGQPLVVSRDAGVPQTNISWFNSNMADVGADFTLFNGKITGSWDYFYRKRTGLRALREDVLVPNEIGYLLPFENLNSDAVYGHEGSLTYNGKAGEINFNVGANYLYSRSKYLEVYKPRYENSWQKYRTAREDRLNRIDWGYEVDGQFQTQEEINNYPVNIDGQGNRTLIPGDLKYKDINGDGKIDGYDERPIGYGGPLPNINLGFTLGFSWKAIDFNMDFSGGAGYTWFQNYEQRWAFQNNGNFNTIFEDRWHRADMRDLNSEWIPGKYPANRYNQGGHSNYNKTSTFWAHNVWYIRARTIQLGYTVPARIMNMVRLNKARFFVNASNLFSIDNVAQYNIDPEIQDDNGLQFPQMRNVNFGFNLTF